MRSISSSQTREYFDHLTKDYPNIKYIIHGFDIYFDDIVNC